MMFSVLTHGGNVQLETVRLGGETLIAMSDYSRVSTTPGSDLMQGSDFRRANSKRTLVFTRNKLKQDPW